MPTEQASHLQRAQELFLTVASDISLITEGAFTVGDSQVDEVASVPEGAGQIHISFRLRLEAGTEVGAACVLMPLPEAISLAGSLMMLSEEDVDRRRSANDLDPSTKDAIMEVGNMLASAAECSLIGMTGDGAQVRFEGCQGVRADTRPRLEHLEEDALALMRVNVRCGEHPASPVLFTAPVRVFSTEA